MNFFYRNANSFTFYNFFKAFLFSKITLRGKNVLKIESVKCNYISGERDSYRLVLFISYILCAFRFLSRQIDFVEYTQVFENRKINFHGLKLLLIYLF